VTLKQALSRAREMLVANNIEDASLESELLLRHTLNISRTQLYLDLDRELAPQQEKTFWNLIKRRLSYEPTAYITGHREFYGFDFYVNPAVLIPRPESELLVEKALSLAQNRRVATIAEIGTGCGAIAISLALHLPQTKIYATDISASALEVALINCQKHGMVNRIYLLQGDMLDPLPEPVDLMVANLPYVREAELLRMNSPHGGKDFIFWNPPIMDETRSVRYSVSLEPLLALNGGRDGLQKIRQLCCQLSNKLHSAGYLLLEIGQGQRKVVTAFLRSLFPSAKIEVAPDLGGIDRVVSLTLTPDWRLTKRN